MKKIILSALVLSLAFAVKAQEIPDRKSEKPGMMHNQRHHGGMDQMKNLNLTEDQKAKFKSQNETFRNQMAELKKNDDITVREWKEKAEAIRNAHKEAMKSILTSEQKAKMKTMREEGKAKHEEMAKKMGDRFKTELNLTAEQSAKLESNRKVLRDEMTKIRENKALTEQQKREQMMQLHKKQKETLKTILTPEQLQKMKEKQQGHPGHDGMRKKPATDKTI